MKRATLAFLLATAGPALAQTAPPDSPAQAPTPAMPNLANPQAAANMGQQAPNAATSRGSTDARSIPTPELSRRETPTPQR